MKLIIDLVIALKKVPIFHQIPEHILAELAQIIKIEEFEANEQIIKKGGLGDCMYIIYKGKVKVHDGDQLFATLSENDIVGELALIALVERTADVSTIEPCVLFRIDREYFLDLLYSEPEMVSGVLRVLVERIVNLNMQIKQQEASA
jgi:CRP-like cAMP-binding protein